MRNCGSCGTELKSNASCRNCAGMDALAIALCCIQRQPTMWLHSNDSLGEVQAFITGFQHGQSAKSDSTWFDSFTKWVAVHYGVNAAAINGFGLIREHVGNDEKEACEEFFRLLPNYIRDMEKIGPDGIGKKYMKLIKRLFPRQFELVRKAKRTAQGRKKSR